VVSVYRLVRFGIVWVFIGGLIDVLSCHLVQILINNSCKISDMNSRGETGVVGDKTKGGIAQSGYHAVQLCQQVRTTGSPAKDHHRAKTLQLCLSVQLFFYVGISDQDMTSWTEIKVFDSVLESGLEVLDSVTEIPFMDESSEWELLSLLGDWYEPKSIESLFSSMPSDAVFFSY